MLKDEGYSVVHSRDGWAENVDKRAANLRENVLQILDETEAKKINIIAHSMGGLDARL